MSDNLKHFKPLPENNVHELAKCADILKRAVVSLKENRWSADLEIGALYYIILDIIPLLQYYRKFNERGMAEEADYQVKTAEVKQRFMQLPLPPHNVLNFRIWAF